MAVFGEGENKQKKNPLRFSLFQTFNCKESRLMVLTLTSELSSNCSSYSLPALLIAKDSQLGADTSGGTNLLQTSRVSLVGEHGPRQMKIPNTIHTTRDACP